MFGKWFDTSLKKKPLKWACGVFGVMLGVALIFHPFFSFAWYPTFLIDWFDTYNLGDLHNQGNWIAENPSYSPQIVDDFADTLPNSVYNTWDSAVRKNVDSQNSGALSWWFRAETELGQNTHHLQIQNYSDFPPDYPKSAFFITAECFDLYCQFKYSDGNITKIYAEFNLETWYKVELTWDCDFDTYTLKFGDLPVITNIAFFFPLSSTDRVRFSAEHFWVDTFGVAYPPCELGNCQYCETYNSCINAGCYWYYSIYLQEYYCVEPYEEEPEACGSFYKCQFCLTQETCEAQLNCEWIDKGFGFKCYMIEPEIPPEQVEWEVPELEDCSALSGVEKWLCEIKNFIAGIFLPSQAKMDSLYQTIMSVKDKFPFNYANALKVFFADIRTELQIEKSIPVKIFTAESNVDFSFWDRNVVIGGFSETFGNILIDFTTFIIVLGFLVWLISFIKRIF